MLHLLLIWPGWSTIRSFSPSICHGLRTILVTVGILPCRAWSRFCYWSKERLAGKAIVGVTEVNILHGSQPGLPEVLVAGKEFFATHYIRASLGLTALAHGEPGRANYLVYVNRSKVDVLGGMFGGIVRWFMERRLTTEAADVLQGLRRRLESGEPPPAVATGSP